MNRKRPRRKPSISTTQSTDPSTRQAARRSAPESARAGKGSVQSGPAGQASKAIDPDDAAQIVETKSNPVASRRIRIALSVWLPLHFLAIGLSCLAVVEPSSIHAVFVQLCTPYLQSTHFGADDRPVYLAYGEPSEQPHRLQVTRDGSQWTDVVPLRRSLIGQGGLAGSDRMARWLSTLATLAENEQPSLVAELLLPIVIDDPAIIELRIARLTTDLNEINAETEYPYRARVVRDGDIVALVQLNDERLSAKVVDSMIESPSGNAPGVSSGNAPGVP